jgi:Na+-driven multidrug efflux pump
MIEQIIMRVGMIIFTKTVASLGTVAYATHNVCMNIQQMSFMLGQAFAVSATSLVGQSLGKKRPDMAQFYSSRARRIGLVVSLTMAAIFFFFGNYIVGLYSNDPAIQQTGGQIMRLAAFILPFQSSQFILAGALRGAGDTKSTAVITFFTVLLIRPGVALLLVWPQTVMGPTPDLALMGVSLLGIGIWGAWIALVLDQLLRSLLVLLRYNSGKWKRVKV